MGGTWQEALMFLNERGWSGELVDGACAALLEACGEGELEGREVASLTPAEIARTLAEPVAADEAAALGRVAEVHDRGDVAGEALRAALVDLDAFAASLGEA